MMQRSVLAVCELILAGYADTDDSSSASVLFSVRRKIGGAIRRTAVLECIEYLGNRGNGIVGIRTGNGRGDSINLDVKGRKKGRLDGVLRLCFSSSSTSFLERKR